MQEFLNSYTNDLVDNLWLGGKYDNVTTQFRWIDGEPLTYANWADGYPRASNDTDACIYVRPPNTKTTTDAQWEDSTCQRRNLAICQKPLSWTLQDAVNEIIKNRKELEVLNKTLEETVTNLTKTEEELLKTKQELTLTKQDLVSTKQDLSSTKQDLTSTKQDLSSTKQDLSSTKQDLVETKNKVVPVGSIYIEYYNQASPKTLWPTLSWLDITSSYAGLFFRVLGSGSDNWGVTQSPCAPRMTQMAYTYEYPSWGDNPLTIPSSGWSKWGEAGLHTNNANDRDTEVLKFYTEGCEVRPKNQAIRIWKRQS